MTYRGFLWTAAAILLLLFLRRPDALLHPQFFAEDGVVFFHDQIVFGLWEALWVPHGGYLLMVQRLTAWWASFFPPIFAPALYNLTALMLSAACCAALVLPPFRKVIRSDGLRIAVACLMAIALDSAELIGTITQIQWFLQIAGILLLVRHLTEEHRSSLAWQLAEAALLLVLALSSPLLVLAVPLAMLLVLQRRAVIQSLSLMAGVGVQLLIYIAAGESRGQSSVFQFHDMLGTLSLYLAARPILSSVVGRPYAMELCAKNTYLYAAWAGGLVLVGLALMWWKADRGTKGKILVCLYLMCASGVLSLGARKMLRAEETITFGGERYFYLAACCFVLLAAIGIDLFLAARPTWAKAVILCVLFAGGVAGNFSVHSFFPLYWGLYQDVLHNWYHGMRNGDPIPSITIPINPSGWAVTLEGNVLTDGGFEAAVPLAWHPYGAAMFTNPKGFNPLREAAIQMSRLHSFEGQASLRVDGQKGGAEQLLRNLKPHHNYRVSMMVFSECTLKGIFVLSLENIQLREMAHFDATPPACGQWLPYQTSFEAPKEGAVWLRLGNAEGGLISYWDAVKLQEQ